MSMRNRIRLGLLAALVLLVIVGAALLSRRSSNDVGEVDRTESPTIPPAKNIPMH